MLMVAGLGDAQPECETVEGTFVNQAVAPPECDSPVFFCTHGDLSGDLEGDYDFTMLSQTPDLEGPPVTMAFTGESTITLADGAMSAEDHGSITLQLHAPSPFETHVEIHGGSGAYVGATGSLLAKGEYDVVMGEGSGTYEGVICT